MSDRIKTSAHVIILSSYQRYNRLVSVLAVMTILHRILILDLDLSKNFGRIYYNPGNKIETFRNWWDQYSDAILSGIASDFFFILAVSLIALILKPKATVPLLLLVGIFYAANIEHIHYNFAHIDLGTLHMALDRTFIEGSGMTWAFFMHSGIMTLIVLAGFLLTGFARVVRILSPVAILMLGTALALPHGIDPLNSRWMQTHPLALSTRVAIASSDQRNFSDRVFRVLPPQADLPRGQLRNVLIVYLEGVSQHSLSQGDMPYLQGLARENFAFNRYFGNQIQTSNGLFTTLTGHMPNFLRTASPWNTLTVDDPAAQGALPLLLAQKGYHTAFLQSAPLKFMNKDKHLAQLGFQVVKGRDDWQSFRNSNGWGIDDLSLFENALDYIGDLNPEAPWLVSLLTSGTHAPYNVPEDFLPTIPTRLRALKYADAAAEALMAGLQAQGMLDNTVVIFTADESREPGGMTNLENEILLNWLPLIVVHPNGERGAVDWPVSSTEFRNLALLVAGSWSAPDTDPLRRPDTPLVFGNHYNSRVFWLDKRKSEFFACFTQDFLCAQFNGVKDVVRLNGMIPEAVFQALQMQTIFEERESVD